MSIRPTPRRRAAAETYSSLRNSECVTRNDLRLLVVDYLQLMTSTSRRENRVQEMSEISRGLKTLAMELEIPIVVVSQLNRASDLRADKRPALADLRDSGQIEQDGDLVILLYREDAVEKESARAGEADLILAKHRNGPTSTVTVAFQGATTGSSTWPADRTRLTDRRRRRHIARRRAGGPAGPARTTPDRPAPHAPAPVTTPTPPPG